MPTGVGPEALFEYPYARPEGSFITDGKNVFTLPSEHATFFQASQDYLSAEGLPLMDKRIPVIAYGANVSPAKIRDKMAKYGSPMMQQEMQTIPMLAVDVPNSQVVWHGKPGQSGGVFAELYSGESVEGENASAVVQYLTVEQLGVMHTTEGETYRFVPLTVNTVDGEKLRAFAYVAGSSQVLVKDGKPVPVTIPGREVTPGPSGMTVHEAVAYMLEHGGGGLEVHMRSPEGLIRANVGKKLATRKLRQEAVRVELTRLGMSRAFSHPHSDTYIGRADFVSPQYPGHTPEVLLLAEQSLERIRPGVQVVEKRANELVADGMIPEAALRKARAELDVMEGLSGVRHRATKELSNRTGLAIIPADQVDKVQTGPNTYTISRRITDG